MIEEIKNININEMDSMNCDEMSNYENDLYTLTIPFNVENISGCVIDKELFEQGIKEVSKLCGAISALSNVGINPHKAMEYLATEFVSNNEIEIAKINAEATVDASKNESFNTQKMTI